MLSLSLQYWKHSNACHYNHPKHSESKYNQRLAITAQCLLLDIINWQQVDIHVTRRWPERLRLKTTPRDHPTITLWRCVLRNLDWWGYLTVEESQQYV